MKSNKSSLISHCNDSKCIIKKYFYNISETKTVTNGQVVPLLPPVCAGFSPLIHCSPIILLYLPFKITFLMTSYIQYDHQAALLATKSLLLTLN